MLIIPAIDIRGGHVVRLLRGDFAKETVYHDDPVAMAQQWVAQGARYLHIVDLDGARSGMMQNHALIQQIASTVAASGAKIEVGGGIRSTESIEELLGIGVDRVVLGTRAFDDRDFRRRVMNTYGDRLAIAVDSHRGTVVTQGWTVARVTVSMRSDSEFTFVDELLREGVRHIIYTEVSKDGTLSGPAFEGVQRLLTQVGGQAQVIASGGVGTLEHVRQLKSLTPPLAGVIVGKALSDGRLQLAEALALSAG